MAIVVSGPKLKGKAGGFSYYQDANGNTRARQRRSTPNNLQKAGNALGLALSIEFANISRTAKLIKQTMPGHLPYYSDADYFGRLVALLRYAADMHSDVERGARNCFDGNPFYLRGFEFNKNYHLSDLLQNLEVSTKLDTKTGTVSLHIDSFSPRSELHFPTKAKYFQIVINGSSVNDEDRNFAMEVSDLIPITHKPTGPIDLSVDIPHMPGDLLLGSVGILFYEEVYGIPQMMRGRGCMQIFDLGFNQPKHNKSRPSGSPAPARKSYKEHMDHLDTTLKLKFKLPTIATGTKNKQPAGDFDGKLQTLRRKLFFHRIRQLQKGRA